MYLIEILHQTTTIRTTSKDALKLYLIEILHQTTTCTAALRILPRCILSKFYIKPQLTVIPEFRKASCILSKFYIKPQHVLTSFELLMVVSYRNSTSNHNDVRSNPLAVPVVSYRNSTSNHNTRAFPNSLMALYLIEILHQTTTEPLRQGFFLCCILSKFYIKPQQCSSSVAIPAGCILSKFYIKPQLIGILIIKLPVVSYRNSTSNHNQCEYTAKNGKLYLIEILHQTTTHT